MNLSIRFICMAVVGIPVAELPRRCKGYMMEFLPGIVDGAIATSRRWTNVEAATDEDDGEEGTNASTKEDDDDDAARIAAARARVDVLVGMILS